MWIKNSLLTFTLTSLSAVLLSGLSLAQEEFNTTLVPGMALPAILQTPVNTALNHVHDPVEAAIPHDIYIGSHLILSKDARLKGEITTLDLPIQGKNAVLGIQFLTAVLPDGTQIPMQAYVKTDHPNHLWGGEYTPGTKPYVVTHHVMMIGDYNQAHLGGPRAMGQHIQFLPGEFWTIILEQPLQLDFQNQ